MNLDQRQALTPRNRSRIRRNQNAKVVHSNYKLNKTPIKKIKSKYDISHFLPRAKVIKYKPTHKKISNTNNEPNFVTPPRNIRSFLSSTPISTAGNIESDRFIANRSSSNLLSGYIVKSPPNDDDNKHENSINNKYRKLLKNELLFGYQPKSTALLFVENDVNNNDINDNQVEYFYNEKHKNEEYFQFDKGSSPVDDGDKLMKTPTFADSNNEKNIDCFQSPKRCLNFVDGDNNQNNNNNYDYSSSLTPIRADTQLNISNLSNLNDNDTDNSADNDISKLSSMPYCVLDAPDIVDDFYSSILDWNEYNNLIGIGLADTLYLYNPDTKSDVKFTEIVSNNHHCKNHWQFYSFKKNMKYLKFSSVKFSPDGQCIAMGTNNGGIVSIWDINKHICTNFVKGPANHIGLLEYYNNQCIVYGSKLRNDIFITDLRINCQSTNIINTATQLVSLKFSPDFNRFAIGGRDRCVSIYDIRYTKTRIYKLMYHTSSIRAIEWSPHDHNILISGGGSNDKKICLWNLNINNNNNNKNAKQYQCITIKKPIKCIKTNSQICNLKWHPIYIDYILSTNGYVDNGMYPNNKDARVNLWNLKQNKIVKNFIGHKKRVLYLASNNNKIVTASEDQTLHFWKIFNEKNDNNTSSSSDAYNNNSIQHNNLRFKIR